MGTAILALVARRIRSRTEAVICNWKGLKSFKMIGDWANLYRSFLQKLPFFQNHTCILILPGFQPFLYWIHQKVWKEHICQITSSFRKPINSIAYLSQIKGSSYSAKLSDRHTKPGTSLKWTGKFKLFLKKKFISFRLINLNSGLPIAGQAF